MTIYIMLNKTLDTYKTRANLYEISSVYSTEDIGKTKNVTFELSERDATVITLVDVVMRIQELYPEAEIENLSNTDSVVCRVIKKSPLASMVIKGFIAAVVLFFAAGTAVINFYNDVDMAGSFEKIITIISGENSLAPWVVTVAYAIGLSAGLLLFLGFPSRKKVDNPDAISLEMNEYDTEIDDYVRAKKEK